MSERLPRRSGGRAPLLSILCPFDCPIGYRYVVYEYIPFLGGWLPTPPGRPGQKGLIHCSGTHNARSDEESNQVHVPV